MEIRQFYKHLISPMDFLYWWDSIFTLNQDLGVCLTDFQGRWPIQHLFAWSCLPDQRLQWRNHQSFAILGPLCDETTVLCRLNAVNFINNIYKRNPIAHPLGRAMGCLLWIQPLLDILLLFLQWCMQYLATLDYVIMALNCICLNFWR